jgi:hypothetical protein
MVQLRFFENGTSSTNWSLIGSTVQDEEGNVTASTGPDNAGGYFSPQEARKFRFKLLYRRSSSTPDNILTINDFTFADFASHPFGMFTTNLGQYQIQFTRITRRQISYRITPDLDGVTDRLTIEYTDENGLKKKPVEDFIGNSGVNMDFGSPIPESIKSANITIALITNRFVEFLARPEPAATNSFPAK